MLKIESIQNGIVIDHIPAGKGMDIYKLLELDSQKQSIALLQSVRSEKYGWKRNGYLQAIGTGFPEAVHCPTAVRKK